MASPSTPLQGIKFNPSSFGCSGSGSAQTDKAGIQTSSKITRVLNVAHKITMVALMILAIITAVGLSSAAVLFGGVVAFVSISAFYHSSKFYNYQQICKTAGIVFQNSEEAKQFEGAGKPSECAAIPTEHCADTEVWRHDLIRSAEHNIVISGNYCGGKSFADLLRLIEERMKEKPDLKVVIISSPNFIVNGNQKTIQKLIKDYPQNFSLVESPDIWHLSNGLKKSTNHTKCMVIDYGKYFILGGSGIKDNFAQTGLDHLTKEAFLKTLEEEKQTPSSQETVEGEAEEEIDGNSFLQGGSVGGESQNPGATGKKVQAPEEDHNAEDGLMGRFIPGNFRDMDFVFQSSEDAGKQVYQQMLLLCYRWEQYNQMLNHQFVNDKLKVDQLGLFTNSAISINSEDSVVVQLLKTPVPKPEEITTKVDRFEASRKKSEQVAFQIFASGPEHDTSVFAEELEKKINEAKDQIVINHMYFQPNEAIMDALVNAAKRGVKIKVITSDIYEDCPSSHLAFGPRNKYNYAYLLNSLSDEERKNVEVYSFEQKKKGNHKKVIVIDDTVIAGSSNLGYKSLVTTSDHELNFFARSKEFADETLKICDTDIKYSRKIEGKVSLSVGEYFRAFVHRVLAPLIG